MQEYAYRYLLGLVDKSNPSEKLATLTLKPTRQTVMVTELTKSRD